MKFSFFVLTFESITHAKLQDSHSDDYPNNMIRVFSESNQATGRLCSDLGSMLDLLDSIVYGSMVYSRYEMIFGISGSLSQLEKPLDDGYYDVPCIYSRITAQKYLTYKGELMDSCWRSKYSEIIT